MKISVKKVAAVLLLCVLIFSVNACTKENVDAETIVSDVFDSIKSLDDETIHNYIDVKKYIDSEDEIGLFSDEETMKNVLFSRLDYEIKSVRKVNNGMINANVTVTNIDMSAAADDYTKKIKNYVLENSDITDDELIQKARELFLECAQNPELDLVSRDIVVRIEKDGGWLVVPTEEIESALTGDLLKLMEEEGAEEEPTEEPKETKEPEETEEPETEETDLFVVAPEGSIIE